MDSSCAKTILRSGSERHWWVEILPKGRQSSGIPSCLLSEKEVSQGKTIYRFISMVNGLAGCLGPQKEKDREVSKKGIQCKKHVDNIQKTVQWVNIAVLYINTNHRGTKQRRTNTLVGIYQIMPLASQCWHTVSMKRVAVVSEMELFMTLTSYVSTQTDLDPAPA